MAYSMWLQPTGQLAARLAGQIDSLATRYSAARFQPHITLIGGVAAADDQEMMSRSRELAASLQSYRLHLERLGCSTTHYQCVFLLCEKEPPAMAAAAQARTHFGLQPVDYMPHLSLLYSDLDQPGRQALVQELQQSLCAGSDSLAGVEIQVESLHVWRTPAGETASWQHLGELPLGQTHS